MLISGLGEIIISILCYSRIKSSLKLIILAWVATSFLIYRVGMIEAGWRKPCICLGNLTQEIHISTKAADELMEFVLAYLIIGSYVGIFYIFKTSQATKKLTLVIQK